MTLEFKVPDMACGACANTIIKAIQNLDSQAKVEANTETKQVTVETQETTAAVKEVITSAGFNPV